MQSRCRGVKDLLELPGQQKLSVRNSAIADKANVVLFKSPRQVLICHLQLTHRFAIDQASSERALERAVNFQRDRGRVVIYE